MFSCSKKNINKAWNIKSCADLSLDGPVGQIYAMVVDHDMLFAGAENGTIYAWKPNKETNAFELATTLGGHNCAVVSLTVGGGRLYYVHSYSEGACISCDVSWTKRLSWQLGSPIHIMKNIFTERARLFAKEEVRAIQIGPGGLFFIGDGTGQVDVWKWQAEPTSLAS
uniref:Uncharacterized protein n=1 Tax=Vitis vinifera TaxID=29760 RepID=A5BU89_VITVI|nr:hypothetical protein VITISV_009667 [Vitis vinifera]